MGQFSWFTQDTNEVIYNDWDTYGDRMTVHMVDPRNGNDYMEEEYKGYGVFGGRDFYELYADINKILIKQVFNKNNDLFDITDYKQLTEDEIDCKRQLGIGLWFSKYKGFSLSPILVKHYDNWQKFKGQFPEEDENQGWHIIDEDEDER